MRGAIASLGFQFFNRVMTWTQLHFEFGSFKRHRLRAIPSCCYFLQFLSELVPFFKCEIEEKFRWGRESPNPAGLDRREKCSKGRWYGLSWSISGLGAKSSLVVKIGIEIICVAGERQVVKTGRYPKDPRALL